MRRLFLLATWLISSNLLGQQTEPDLQEFAENLFQIQDEDVSYEDLYESLLQYYTNRLNLNRASPEELSALYILSPLQISEFLHYRDMNGELLSVYELQAIPAFNLEIIRKLRPFVTVKENQIPPKSLLKRIWSEDNNYLLLRYSQRIEISKGYMDAAQDTTFRPNSGSIDTLVSYPNRYLGTPAKLYGRFRVSRRNEFSLGLTFEKDAGEDFSGDGLVPGFDYLSYHLQLENTWGFDKMIIGDFQMQSGQGLVFGAGFSPGKGAETITTVRRPTLGLRPYTSVLETGYFRGAGISKTVGNFSGTLLFSNLRQDGRILSDTTLSTFASYINSIQASGLHRTPSERAAKNEITEQNLGATVQYRPSRRISFGWTGLYTNFSEAIQRRPSAYNYFDFSGHTNFVQSLYGNYTWQNVTLFGELARSTGGGLARVAGLIITLSSEINFSFLTRSYDRNFHSFYASAFSEGSRTINEIGAYWGLEYQLTRKHRVNLYYDNFRFPWLRFKTESPSIGHEWLIRYTFQPSRNTTLFATLKNQTRGVSAEDQNLNVLIKQVRYNYNINISYKITNNLAIKTRIQGSKQIQGSEHSQGFAVTQDLQWKRSPLQFYTSLGLFETDNFDNAQYLYERDVLYAFSIPAYNGKGIRSYMMVRFDPLHAITLWVRYSRFYYPNAQNIGSGLEEIAGNTRSEIKIMARIRF